MLAFERNVLDPRIIISTHTKLTEQQIDGLEQSLWCGGYGELESAGEATGSTESGDCEP